MAVDIKNLKEALDESSKHNRRLFLIFMLFLVYSLVTVASTTDIQLLIPDGKVKLPVVNVELPLFGFYIIAPLLILIFHINLLFNLVHHCAKLYAWDSEREGKNSLLIFPFFINFLLLYKKENIHYFLLRFVIWVTTYFSPLFLLLFIQLKFSAYHSLTMTFWHFILLFTDVLLIFTYWYRITNPALSSEEYDSFKRILSFHLEKGLLRMIKNSLISLVTGRFFIKILKLPISIYHGVKTILNPKELANCIKRSAIASTTFAFWLIIIISIINLSIIVLIMYIKFDYTSDLKLAFYRQLIPSLNLSEETSFASHPNVEIIQNYIAEGKNKEDAWKDFTKGLNLQKRDLRFAILRKLNLQKADLRQARLQGVDLRQAQLQGANLTGAELHGTMLAGAQLQGADFRDAQLQGASLGGATLHRADLEFAQLQGEYLGGAQLQGANLHQAQLQGAYLPGTQLQGAHLSFAQLQGAYLRDAQLQGATLEFAQLQGAYLEGAKLQGTYLQSAELQGAKLTGAELQGAYLQDAHFGCVELHNAKLQGIYFKSLDIKYNFNWDELLNVTKSIISERSRDNFINRIKSAEEQCKNYKEEDLPVPKSNLDEFIGERKKLACKDSYQAEGMLKQRFFDENLQGIEIINEIRPAIIDHMRLKCPDIFEQIKDTLIEYQIIDAE